jgi:hypothetical protein
MACSESSIREERVMSEIIAIPGHRHAGRKHGPSHHALLTALLVTIVAGLGFAVVASTVELLHAPAPPPAEPVVEFRARELPLEWRWQRHAIRLDRAPVAPGYLARQAARARLRASAAAVAGLEDPQR